jgi:hypothetical protein
MYSRKRQARLRARRSPLMFFLIIRKHLISRIESSKSFTCLGLNPQVPKFCVFRAEIYPRSRKRITSAYSHLPYRGRLPVCRGVAFVSDLDFLAISIGAIQQTSHKPAKMSSQRIPHGKATEHNKA